MPEYHASMDMGAYVVVLNAERVVVSGNKFETKLYRRHTGRPGSLKEETFKKLQAVRSPSLCSPERACPRAAVRAAAPAWSYEWLAARLPCVRSIHHQEVLQRRQGCEVCVDGVMPCWSVSG